MNASKIDLREIKIIDKGITAPIGFKAAGNHIGIKKKKKDLTLIVSEVPCSAVGFFTTNIVKAAPVIWCHKNINNRIRGIVINSGNANACTGETGLKHAEIMAETLAECINARKEEILVSSTGIIGIHLPIDTVRQGIRNTTLILDDTRESAKAAAEGIMTTDTFSKEYSVEIELSGIKARIAGIVKGSGMIHPNMATMLAFITTDVNITKEMLRKAVSESVDDSYNMISVDGDTSTNDMVIVLANGMAKNIPISTENKDYYKFKNALNAVNYYLAKQIIMDGEGVTKFLEVRVTGTKTKEDAKKIAKSIITSNLVKTAMFGADANWGRVVCAAGYSGANFDPSKISIEFSSEAGSIITMVYGEPVVFDEDKALKILKQREIKILFTIEEGKKDATAWGCDLSYEYVKINGEYRT